MLASCAHKCVAVFKSLEEALQDLETPADFEWNQAAAVAYFLFFYFFLLMFQVPECFCRDLEAETIESRKYRDRKEKTQKS